MDETVCHGLFGNLKGKVHRADLAPWLKTHGMKPDDHRKFGSLSRSYALRDRLFHQLLHGRVNIAEVESLHERQRA